MSICRLRCKLIKDNYLLPVHELLSDEEAEKILAKYKVSRDEMPKILSKDAAIAIFELKPKAGDIVKVIRNNPVTGKSYYYRVVVEA